MLVVVSTFFGVLLANFIIEVGLAGRVGAPLNPLMGVAGLPRELSIAALIGTMDGRAGHSIVSSLRRKNEIGDEAVIAYNLTTMPLAFISILLKFYMPVVLAALGLVAGGAFLILTFISSLIGMFIGILYGRRKLSDGKRLRLKQRTGKKSRGEAFRSSFSRAVGMTKYVFKRYIVVILLLLVLTRTGFFDWIAKAIQGLTVTGLSPHSLVALSTCAVSPIAGIFMVGDMLRGGLVGIRETLLVLIIGRLLFTLAFEYPRHSFPFYVSMYPAKLAAKLTLTLMLTTVLSTPVLIFITLAAF